MVPEGWSIVSVKDIARVSSGGTPSRSVARYWNGDIPWVTTGEIAFNRIKDTEQKITKEGLENSSAKIFPNGTILLAMYGQGKTRGQVAKLEIDAATNQACAAILINANHEPDFFYHYFVSKYISIRNIGNASTQKNLNAGLIKAFKVLLPPYKEQKKTLVISNEEPKQDIVFRIACLELGYNFNDYKKGRMPKSQQLDCAKLFPEICKYVKIIDVSLMVVYINVFEE